MGGSTLYCMEVNQEWDKEDDDEYFRNVINKITVLFTTLYTSDSPPFITKCINSMNQVLVAKCDSAASKHYIMNEDKKCLTNVNKCFGQPVTNFVICT